MRILSAAQIRALDEATTLEEGITSTNLMERATRAFFTAFRRHYGPKRPIAILCGTGNNGGDGFALARMMLMHYNVMVFSALVGERSHDNAINHRRAKKLGIKIHEVKPLDPFPKFHPDVILIDALFGTGLNRPLEGYWADFVDHYNEKNQTVVALDLPSGMLADTPSTGSVLRAERTISLGVAKLALFAPSNTQWLGRWEIAPFKLAHPDIVTRFLEDAPAFDAFLMEPNALRKELKHRYANDHKGVFGHALLVAGAFGTMGAAVIAGRAVLRSGAGLLTCHVPRSGYEIMQISFPEAMCKIDVHRYRTTEVGDLSPYATIGAGPGLGTEVMTAAALRSVLERYDRPMVLDADALNIISAEPDLLQLVPKNSILTPHPKEFERLCGATEHDFARWQVQGAFAKQHGIYLLLKTGYTSVATPSGNLYFNPTGNPGMGTAGTGDALTGVIVGLLAQGYLPEHAACLGVYLHGLAGDIAAEELGQEFLLAEDVVGHLGQAFRQLRQG